MPTYHYRPGNYEGCDAVRNWRFIVDGETVRVTKLIEFESDRPFNESMTIPKAAQKWEELRQRAIRHGHSPKDCPFQAETASPTSTPPVSPTSTPPSNTVRQQLEDTSVKH